MEDNSLYCSECFKTVSDTIWHTPFCLDHGEEGYRYEDTQRDWMDFFFRPIGQSCYSKVKQH